MLVLRIMTFHCYWYQSFTMYLPIQNFKLFLRQQEVNGNYFAASRLSGVTFVLNAVNLQKTVLHLGYVCIHILTIRFPVTLLPEDGEV